MNARLLLVALLLLAGVACKHNKNAANTVRARASFDFVCPKDELTLRVADTEGARKLATQMAAYGCGKKAVYVFYPDTHTWVIDGAIADTPPDFEIPANVTKGKDKKRQEKKAAKAEKKGDLDSSNKAPAPEPTPEPAAPESVVPETTPSIY